MKNTEHSFGFLILDTARLMRRNFNRDIQDLNITQAQWQILFHISRNDGIRQAQLADTLEMQPISVARLIDRMQSAGWVRRSPDPNDRRAVNLHLEEKAEGVLDLLRERAIGTREKILRGISEAEQMQLLDILQRMRTNLTAG